MFYQIAYTKFELLYVKFESLFSDLFESLFSDLFDVISVYTTVLIY